MPISEVENYQGYDHIGPTPADLKAIRMHERFETSLSGLTGDQRELGNSIARVLDKHGIDHKVIFAANTVVVLMTMRFKDETEGKLYAVAVPYDIKGDDAVQGAIELPLKTFRNRAPSDTMARFMASLKEPPADKPKRRPKKTD